VRPCCGASASPFETPACGGLLSEGKKRYAPRQRLSAVSDLILRSVRRTRLEGWPEGFAGKIQDLKISALPIIFLASRFTKGVVRRRLVDGIGTAAPAVVPRKHGSGRPRVTVRAYYEGLPMRGLDAGRMKAAKAAGSRG
jgi:hypothetical protein